MSIVPTGTPEGITNVETKASEPAHINQENTAVPAENALVEPKLYANKYKTPEDLETAYIEAQRKITESSTKVNEISNKLKEFEAPAEYVIELDLPDLTKSELTKIAKDAALSQSQFGKVVTLLSETSKEEVQLRETKRQEVASELGDEKIQKLDHYLDTTFGEKIGSALKEYYKHDKDVAIELFNQRESELNMVFKSTGGVAIPEAGADRAKMRELAVLMGSSNQMEAARARQEFERLAKAMK